MTKVVPTLDSWFVLHEAMNFMCQGTDMAHELKPVEYTLSVAMDGVSLPDLTFRTDLDQEEGILFVPTDKVTDEELVKWREATFTLEPCISCFPYVIKFNMHNADYKDLDWSFLFQREGFLLPYALEVEQPEIIEITD
jgi:hypothetical protein